MRTAAALLSFVVITAGCQSAEDPIATEANSDPQDEEQIVESIADSQGAIVFLDDLPVFSKTVGEVSNPTLVDVDLCSHSQKECVHPPDTEICSLEGEAEIIFFYTATDAYLWLSNDDGLGSIGIQLALENEADAKRYSTSDGRVLAEVSILL